ncbi:MAG: hypothetical protein AABW73_00155 [Nanoarchaeota archaeon]
MKISNYFGVAALGLIASMLAYSVSNTEIHRSHKASMFSKIEKVADTDSNGSLSVDEISAVYQTIGLNPSREMRSRGLVGLREGEMRDYFKAKEKYDSQTDDLRSFWLPERDN